MALVAGDRAHIGLDLLLDPGGRGLPEAALQVVDDPLKGRCVAAGAVLALPPQPDLLSLGAVEEDVDDLLRQLPQGGVQGEVVVLGKALHVHGGNGAALHGPAAGLQPPFVDGQPFVRDDELRVNLHKHPQAGALFAGAEGVVEGEHPGGQLLHADAVLRAGVVLGEGDVLPVDDVDDDHPAGEARGRLDGVRQAGADVRLDDQPVHDDLDGVLAVLLQLDLLVQVVDQAVHPGPHKAGTPGRLELLHMLALAAPHHRRQNLDAGLLRQGEHLVHNLVDGLLLDLPAADGAVGNADAGIEQPQVVVDLRHRAHGGAGVFGGGLLVDGDGGGKAVDHVHVGLFHLAQKHPGIGGKALHIAPLALGVDGVKGQGGLPRAGKAGEHHQLVPGDGHVDVFQVVLPGAVHYDFI